MKFDISQIPEIERNAIPEIKRIQAQAREEKNQFSRSSAAAANATEMVQLYIDLAGFHDQTAALIESYQAERTPANKFALVDQTGHLVASVLSFIPAARPVQLAVGPTVLGTTTFGILAKLQAGEQINHNDVLTLVSDTAGVVAVVAVIVGAGATVGFATAIGASITAFQLLDTRLGFWNSFQTSTTNQIATYHPTWNDQFPDLLYGYNGYMTEFFSVSPQNPGIAKIILETPSGDNILSVEPRYDSYSADPYPFPATIPSWHDGGSCSIRAWQLHQCIWPDE